MPPVPAPLDGTPNTERKKEVMHNGWRLYSRVDWVFAKQMTEPFEVLQGDLATRGERNDWLVMGNKGQLWIVTSKDFMEEYKP